MSTCYVVHQFKAHWSFKGRFLRFPGSLCQRFTVFHSYTLQHFQWHLVVWWHWMCLLGTPEVLERHMLVYYTVVCWSLRSSGSVPRGSEKLRRLAEQFSNTYFVFFAMTNKCAITSQIITLLHVSTLSYRPQGACNQYLTKLHKFLKCSCW